MSSLETLPQHIGIIMDGNGRWAKQRGQKRTDGHKEGTKAAKRIIQAASDLKIPYVSLYVFSTENWKRAQQEVSFLFSLVRSYLLKEMDFYREKGIRVVHSGHLDALPKDVQADIVKVQKDTAHFDHMTVNLAINYGGQDEILRAFQRWQADPLHKELTQESFYQYLDQPAVPPVDLVIRTAGEIRLSNFLLWESAYAEFYFSQKCWPDWQAEDLQLALEEYGKRQRKYGAVHGE